MGFKSLLENQVQGLMGILGQVDGLAPAQSFQDVTASAYDPSDGTVTDTIVTTAGIPMVLARYSSEEIDGDKIQTDDLKAIVAALDMPVVPTRKDRILLSDGRVFLVEKVGGVPGESVWILQVRETNA